MSGIKKKNIYIVEAILISGKNDCDFFITETITANSQKESKAILIEYINNNCNIRIKDSMPSIKNKHIVSGVFSYDGLNELLEENVVIEISSATDEKARNKFIKHFESNIKVEIVKSTLFKKG